MVVLRQQYPKAGRADMIRLLLREKNMKVSRAVVMKWFDQWEPDLVRERKHRRLRRKRFWAAGAADVWCVDQHDKWKKYGLGLHTGVDPFIGQIKWLRVWWTNRNPRLIFRYYLDTVRRLRYTSLVIQSDPGSENFCLAKGHTYIRCALDPDLEGTIQHRWKREKKNIPPETLWSNLRRRFTPGFEDILDAPLRHPELRYDRFDPLQYNVFKWVFIPWIQAELDGWADGYNNTRKRYQKDKVLPQGGSPDDMEEYPDEYGFVNFKINIDPNGSYLTEAEQLWAPPDHEVFELVPKDFGRVIQHVYDCLGAPPVTRDNVWTVYMDLLEQLERDNLEGLNLAGYNEDEDNYTVGEEDADMMAHLARDLEDLQPLRDDTGECYMGGVNGGLGAEGDVWDENVLDAYAEFSSDEEDDANYDGRVSSDDELDAQEVQAEVLAFSDEDEE
ncbi:hypothetical protein PQX77_011603 [Marasmius sp. AFHP31]|nr:hypothetical protein PQX77_011603 [Marasmius sp. AFHP31]